MSIVTILLLAVLIVLAALLVASERRARATSERLRQQLADAEARFREQQKMVAVGQAVSSLTQELKSRLQNVLGNTELMLATGSANSSTEEFRDIQQNVERAAGLVRNLSAFTETISLSRRWQDLNEIVKRGVAVCSNQLADAGVQLEVQPSERLPLVYVDGRQLEKVIATLLAHPASALGDEASAPSTLTTAHDETSDGHLVVELNELDVQIVDQSAWSVELAACRRIVEAHGGVLDVDAQPGKAFRFRLELPVTPVGGGPSPLM